MAVGKGSVGEAPITAAADALANLCPDLQDWPQRWRGETSDVVLGERILECFKPFLLQLLGQGLTTTTLRRHRDHLWMLGGEIIRRCYDEPELRHQPARTIVLRFIDDECDPLIWPEISEQQQNAFDGTCRKLHQFLVVSAKRPAQHP
ncbi:MAG: hypothetical protein IT495_21680 [Gammaproteobacteria bacterium]|nr:hypothetical protein [Gammaproteobacteria bacterium]